MDDSFVNLGEEIILTLLWQSGACESATVCFVISLSICYWLLKCRVLRVVCVREWVRESHHSIVCVCVCVLACVRGRHGHTTAACVLQIHTIHTYEYIHHHGVCVCHVTLFPFLAWTDGKTKDIINFTFILKAKAHDYGKGRYISDSCLRCWATHMLPVGQSEQTALVGRRDFVENEAFERGGV